MADGDGTRPLEIAKPPDKAARVVCPSCKGSGQMVGRICVMCAGSGLVTVTGDEAGDIADTDEMGFRLTEDSPTEDSPTEDI